MSTSKFWQEHLFHRETPYVRDYGCQQQCTFQILFAFLLVNTRSDFSWCHDKNTITIHSAWGGLMIVNFNFILISLRFSAILELYHWETSFHEWLSWFIMVKPNGWKICVIVDDAGTIWVWCSYWTFSFTIQRKLLQFYQAILLTPQSHLFVWILIWEETDQVNMEHFGFSFLHELAARNLFKILMPTLDQIVFMQVQAAN